MKIKFETFTIQDSIKNLLAKHKEFIYQLYPQIYNVYAQIINIQNGSPIYISMEERDFLQNQIQILWEISKKESIKEDKEKLIQALNIIAAFLNKDKNNIQLSYNKKIKDKTIEIESLTDKVNQLEKEKALLNSQAVQENEAKAKEIEKYKKQLAQSEADKAALIKRYEEEKERQNKLRDDWENNIKRAFEALNEGAKVVNDEYKRIKRAHLFYGLGIVFSVSLLFLLVRYTILSLYIHDEIMTYVQYIPYYLPLAFCGTLIWICIYQTNKLQRQLIALADKIYRIKYLEGALKGLNNVEQDKDLLSQKTIDVLDRIINKHLNESFKDMNEKNIEKEEDKDTYPVDNLIKLMKEFKEFGGNK